MRGPISIAVTGPLGLGSEAIASIKESRAKKNGDLPEPLHREYLEDDDEWMLDEVQDQKDKKESSTGKTMQDLKTHIYTRHRQAPTPSVPCHHTSTTTTHQTPWIPSCLCPGPSGQPD